MTFELDSEELKKFEEWREKIKALYGEYGDFTYTIYSNGIGYSLKVKSELTGLVLDLTDQSKW